MTVIMSTNFSNFKHNSNTELKIDYDLSKFAVQNLKITEDHQDQRLDNFLYNLFNKQIARSLIYSIIRTGQVRINSGRVKHNYHLNINDNVRIPPIKSDPNKLNKDADAPKKTLNKQQLKIWQSKLEKAIVFENQNLLIINKPAKLAVHGGSQVNIGLIEVLRSIRPNEYFLELVHRLDKDTSGCLMIAKKRSYLKKLHLLLRERKITKIYSVLVQGIFTEKKVVELLLKKIIKNSKEHFVKVSADGSYAKTICTPEKCFVLKGFANLNSSLITAKPLTGKTHQIRVHLASIGFPIVNDDKYGNREYNSQIQKFGLNRMFLHAKSLQFACPQTGDTIIANAEYDTDLTNFLLKLGANL